MLTRLRVKGFKNLVDLDISFGALTCIAGVNGVGKSNIFDAIHFLSLLADKTFVDAANAVRGGREPKEIFLGRVSGNIALTADIVIPPNGVDDFGQPAEASNTFLRYELILSLEDDDSNAPSPPKIRLKRETLSYITKGEAKKNLPFPHTKSWRDSAVRASSRRTTFITTENPDSDNAIVRLQSDRMRDATKSKRGGGKAPGFLASRLPRTVLSSAQNADESRTAVLVRQEMRRWRLLQLEPTSLRREDDFESPVRLDRSGAHIPATLYRLAHNGELDDDGRVYAEIANRLARLIDDVHSVRVDRDEARRVLQFMMRDRHGLELPASALSDGTMRFVALSIIESDPTETGVICLEEPENGIHPQRIASMLSLLYDIAVDVKIPIDDKEGNPLRQVIITTHSPVVAAQVREVDLIFARTRHYSMEDGRPVKGIETLGLNDTWRTKETANAVDFGEVLEYLNPILASEEAQEEEGQEKRDRRVIDAVDQSQPRLFPTSSE